MDKQLKIGVYNKILRALSQNPNISKLEKEIGDKLELTCLICDGIEFEFMLHTQAEILIIRATTPGIDFDESKVTLTEIASEVIEDDSDINYSTYEDKETEKSKIVFQHVVPLVSMEGVEGQKQIFNTTLGFVHLMCRNKDKLGCDKSKSIGTNMDFTNEADDDPFDFNSFSDEEVTGDLKMASDDVSTMLPEDDIEEQEASIFAAFEQEISGKSEAEEVDDVKPTVVLALDKGDEVGDERKEEEEMDIFAGILDNSQSESNSTTENVQEDVKVEEDEDIDAMLAKIEAEKQRRKKEREERKKARENKSSKNTDTNNANKKANKPNVMNKGISEDVYDTFAGLLDDSDKSKKDTEKSTKNAKNNKVEQNNTANTEKKGDKVDKNMVESVVTPINYERAPEVVEQMKHLYAEIDQVFEQRKKQADYREETLNKFSDRLDKREKELNKRAERLEKNYQEKQKDLDNKAVAFETQNHEIKFQWDKLKMEQDMLAQQKKDLDESIAVFEKSKNLAMPVEDKEEQLNMLNAELEEREKEIEVLRTTITDKESDYKSQIEELTAKLAEVGENSSSVSEDDIRELEDKISDLEEENEDLKADVDDLAKEGEQKDQIIQTLKDKQKSFKEKETAWVNKEKSYKQQIANAAKENSGASSEAMNDLQDSLDMANMRIKELEAEVAKAVAASGSSDEDAATIKRLNQELEQAKSDLEKADEAYENERKAKETALAERDIAMDTNKLAVNIKDSLYEIGIEVEPVATNGELVLSGSSDSAQVIVNVTAGMLYISKSVKRGIKYRQTFEKWNNEDIRSSYLFSDKEIVCKCVYEDVSKAAIDILSRFASLN